MCNFEQYAARAGANAVCAIYVVSAVSGVCDVDVHVAYVVCALCGIDRDACAEHA